MAPTPINAAVEPCRDCGYVSIFWGVDEAELLIFLIKFSSPFLAFSVLCSVANNFL